MTITRLSIVLLFTACRGADDPADESTPLSPEEEQALEAANDALAASLFATDSASYVLAQPTRAVCPAIAKDGTITDFVVTVDYGDGCTPSSGLVAAEMSGGLAVAYATQQVDVTFDSLAADETSVDGWITGAYVAVGLGDGATITLDSELDFATVTTEQSLTAEIGSVGVVVDGTASVDSTEGSASSTIDAVSMDYLDIWAACPLPHGGSITVDVDGDEISVTFLEDTPQTGEVEVSFNAFTTTTTFCPYASALY